MQLTRTVEPLPLGDAGTLVTLDRMARTVYARAGHPVVRSVAVQLAREVLPRDVAGQIGAIRRYLSEHVHFLNDPLGTEWVGDPVQMLGEIAKRYYINGDCDDVAVLGASLGASIGILPRFVVLGFLSPDAPMGHVYTELYDGSQWRELDTTRNITETHRVSMTARTWLVPLFE